MMLWEKKNCKLIVLINECIMNKNAHSEGKLVMIRDGLNLKFEKIEFE